MFMHTSMANLSHAINIKKLFMSSSEKDIVKPALTAYSFFGVGSRRKTSPCHMCVGLCAKHRLCKHPQSQLVRVPCVYFQFC